MIPFNKPYFTGNETVYIKQAVKSGKISGNGIFMRKCHEFFQERYGFKRCLLTTSCTDALEMAAILCDIKEGDEVIVPSYTFVSTANAFVLRGAKIIFADSRKDHPGIDENKIENLISPRTKAIAVVHYAGIACDMDKILDVSNRHNLIVVEDTAHAIDSFYKGRPLGGIGHFGCFSFHETKNIQCGEGGMLVINDEKFINRAEIIWEKGTNRVAFHRGEINQYTWIDIGSSFLPSEISAAFLFAQLENLENIQNKRKMIWQQYYEMLSSSAKNGLFNLPFSPDYSTNPWHMFYLLFHNLRERDVCGTVLMKNKILGVSHYLSLHKSPFYQNRNEKGKPNLINADRYQDTLLRLPLYYELTSSEITRIVQVINNYNLYSNY